MAFNSYYMNNSNDLTYTRNQVSIQNRNKQVVSVGPNERPYSVSRYPGRKPKKNGPMISAAACNGGMGEDRYDARFKVLILGNSGVGKTSILRSLVGEGFYETTISTIGIDMVKKIFKVDDYRILLEIWDTAGQEQFLSIVSLHFRDAKAFIIVYDLTDEASFDQIRRYWLHSVDKHLDYAVPVFFVANKVDMADKRKVAYSKGEELASQQFAFGFFETSAKTGNNVKVLFGKVAEAMISAWGAPKRYYDVEPQDKVANIYQPVDFNQTPKFGLNKCRNHCCHLH